MTEQRRPLRVIVCGPGTVGGACLREIMKLPEFELVGVLAYSKTKEGLDAGDLVGMPPTGVTITCNKDEILATEADCVLHCALSLPDQTEMDDDVCRLLESGKNVISSAAYHFPSLRGEDYVKRLERACRVGNSSLHGSSIHPSFMIERLGVTLTGLVNRLDMFKMQEISVVSRIPSHELAYVLGFGRPNEDFAEDGDVMKVIKWYYHESLTAATLTLFGRLPDTIETRTENTLAEHDLNWPSGIITKARSAVVSTSLVAT